MYEKDGNAIAGLVWGTLFSLPIWASVIGLILYFTSN
jgi:hypothetical protein